LQDPHAAELDVVAARAAAAIARQELVDAAVPAFLLRRYLATDATELRDALELALAQALTLAAADTTILGRSAWLMLLVEATAVADDERILPAAVALIAALRAAWPAQSRIDEASASVEACLRAAEIVDAGGLVQDSIDQLERIVGGSYRPGDGLVRERAGVRVRGSLEDHARAASALLTAFDLTGRLPYSMLAEELIVFARREPSNDGSLETHCAAARVLCRLAILHDDPEYRGAAVIAGGADYRAEAARILAEQSPRVDSATPSAAAAYGLALLDLLK
jgi:uncharacterized protein YyaL (SSP411 family)